MANKLAIFIIITFFTCKNGSMESSVTTEEEPFYIGYSRFLIYLTDVKEYKNLLKVNFDTIDYEIDTVHHIEYCTYYKKRCNGIYDTILDNRPICFVFRCGNPTKHFYRDVSMDTFTNRLIGSDILCFRNMVFFKKRLDFVYSYQDSMHKIKSKQIEFAKKYGFTKRFIPTIPSKVEKLNFTNSYNLAKWEAYRRVANKGIDIYNRGSNKISHYLIEFDLGINNNDCIIKDTNNTLIYTLFFSNKGLRLENYPNPIIIEIDKNTSQVKNPTKWSHKLDSTFRDYINLLGNDWLQNELIKELAR